MVKFITKSVCMALIATLCVGSLSAQSMSRNQAKSANSEIQQSSVPQFVKAKAPSSCNVPAKGRAIVFSEGFESGSMPAGWKFEKTGSGADWQVGDGLYNGSTQVVWPHSGDYFAFNLWTENAGPRDAWMISTGFTLTAGTEYTISFWLGLAGYSNERDKFKVCLGDDQTVAAMTSGAVIYDNPGTSPVACWTQMTFTHTPASTGTYYIGFHAYSDYNWGNDIDIDDIEISAPAGAPCPAITNLAAEVQGTDVKLTWTASEGDPIGYKIYDGTTALATVTETEYVAKNMSAGIHTLGVEALYDGCDPVNVTTTVEIIFGNPVKNLNGTCVDGTLNLTWDEPNSKGGRGFMWLTYSDDNINPQSGIGLQNGGTIMAAARFTPADLAANYIETGFEITQLQIAMNTSGVTNPALKIWTGGTSVSSPGTLVVDQPIDLATVNDGGWTTIDLTTPLVIDATKELRIGYGCTHPADEFPILYDDGPHVQDKSDLLYAGGWTTLNAALGYSWNTCVKAGIEGNIVVPEVVRYDIYKDDAKLGETTATTFTKDDMPDGQSNYCIVAVYDNDAQSEKVCKEITCIACPSVTGTKAEIADCKTATISWTAAAGAKEYKIERDGVAAVTVEASPYTEEFDFENGETYTWTITTICTSGKEADGVIAETTANCVGINELANSVLIYPNPTSGTITITADNFSKVEIYNTVGQLIETKTVETFDVASYNTGIYFFKVYDVYNNNVTKRVMVAK